MEVLIFKRPIFGYLDYRWIAQTPLVCHSGIEVSLAPVPTESPRWNLILADSPRVAGLLPRLFRRQGSQSQGEKNFPRVAGHRWHDFQMQLQSSTRGTSDIAQWPRVAVIKKLH